MSPVRIEAEVDTQMPLGLGRFPSNLQPGACSCIGASSQSGGWTRCRAEAASDVEAANAATGGSELPRAHRDPLQAHFGVDLSSIRIHADPRAGGLCDRFAARAFTYGDHIFFRAGEYRPGHSSGRVLLAHEITHVLQQRSGRASSLQEARLEGEADDEARSAVFSPRNIPVSPIGPGAQANRVQRWRYATAADPNPLPGSYVLAPAAHKARVNAAMAIVGRIAGDRANYGACHSFFRENCPGGTDATLSNQFASAIVWQRANPPARMLASSISGTHNIAYARAFSRGHWALAASFIHELIHTCGQMSHVIGDRAKAACGRLPNI